MMLQAEEAEPTLLLLSVAAPFNSLHRPPDRAHIDLKKTDHHAKAVAGPCALFPIN